MRECLCNTSGLSDPLKYLKKAACIRRITDHETLTGAESRSGLSNLWALGPSSRGGLTSAKILEWREMFSVMLVMEMMQVGQKFVLFTPTPYVQVRNLLQLQINLPQVMVLEEVKIKKSAMGGAGRQDFGGSEAVF